LLQLPVTAAAAHSEIWFVAWSLSKVYLQERHQQEQEQQEQR